MTSRLDMFRSLSRFDPPKGSLADGPWDAYVDWAISQGIAPLAAFNLEYRLGGAGSPEWARDRLLSVYQGSLNDNVMKMVNLKRAIDGLEGRRVVLLGAASFNEGLYPHVAFRPLLEIEILISAEDLKPTVEHLGVSGFKPVAPEKGEGTAAVLFDGRTRLLFYEGLLGDGAALLSRAQPVKVFGPSVFRLALEDAVLVEAFGHEQSDYALPAIAWVDFRELVMGAPSVSGPYSRVPDAGAVMERAKEWNIERELWGSLDALARLFPETENAGARLQPKVGLAARQLISRRLKKTVLDAI